MSLKSNNNNQNGLISCIIPVYNRPKLITECVDSVLSQSYQNYQIIIVDDGSTDNTKSVLEQLACQHPEKITVLHQQNQGPGAARQQGLNHAQGQFVQFLDSDDLLLSDKFKLYMDAFYSEEQPDIVYSITHYYSVNAPEKLIIWQEDQQNITSILPGFFLNRAWATSSPIYKKSLLDQAGKILALSCEEDLEYDCRIGLQNPKVAFIKQHLTDFRDHSGERFSVNNQNRRKQLNHQITAREHIYQSMEQYSVSANSEIRENFAKYLFLLARQAAEIGLIDKAKDALNLAQINANSLTQKDKLAIHIFRLLLNSPATTYSTKLFSRCYSMLHQISQG